MHSCGSIVEFAFANHSRGKIIGVAGLIGIQSSTQIGLRHFVCTAFVDFKILLSFLGRARSYTRVLSVLPDRQRKITMSAFRPWHGLSEIIASSEIHYRNTVH